jgi:hypothetical protein
VTLPPAASHLVTAIKHFIMANEDGPSVALFANLQSIEEDAMLKGLLEFGDSVPPGTPIDKVCKCLLSYLASLPEPVVMEAEGALLFQALAVDDREYQLQGVRGVLQSLPYNHRVLLQLLVQLLIRIEQAKWPMEAARSSLASVLFDGSFKHEAACNALQMLNAHSDAFPTSNLMIQYQVEKGSGLMLTKSAEQMHMLQRLLHRFTQEQRTVAALLGLHPFWISKADVLGELAHQHAHYAKVSEISFVWMKQPNPVISDFGFFSPPCFEIQLSSRIRVHVCVCVCMCVCVVFFSILCLCEWFYVLLSISLTHSLSPRRWRSRPTTGASLRDCTSCMCCRRGWNSAPRSCGRTRSFGLPFAKPAGPGRRSVPMGATTSADCGSGSRRSKSVPSLRSMRFSLSQ